jgi:hypothetical protein
MDVKAAYKKLYIPLSDDDIRKAVPYAPIVRYEELAEYDSIEELLPESRSAIVLFVATEGPSSGHWCAVMRSDMNIYFFDSYGLRPDKNLLFAPRNLRKGLNQSKPHLSYLLNHALKTGFKISFNEVKYQSDNVSIQTCGRWVVSRISFNKYEQNNEPENYKKLIQDKMKSYEVFSDLLICLLVP